MAQPSAKSQFVDTYQREHATTMKVLRSFPADKDGFKPHERSNSATQLAWTFAMENQMMLMALLGPLNLGGRAVVDPAVLLSGLFCHPEERSDEGSTLMACGRGHAEYPSLRSG